MPKIKNWSRVNSKEENFDHILKYWKKDKSRNDRDVVQLKKGNLSEQEYERYFSDKPDVDRSYIGTVYFVSGPVGKKRRIGKTYYKDRSKAEKVAVSWMKNHPTV